MQCVNIYITSILSIIINIGYTQVLPIKVNNQFGFINQKGIIVIKPQYSSVEFFNGKQFTLVHKDVKSLVIDTTGKFFYTLPPKDSCCYITDDNILVSYNKYKKIYSIISLLNNHKILTLSNHYCRSVPIISNGLIKIEKKGKYGFIDIYGKIVINCIYAEATDFKYNRSIVKINGETQIIDINGKIVSKVFTEFLMPFTYGGYAQVIKNGKYSLVDTMGNLKFSFVYDFMCPLYNGFIIYRQHDYMGLYDFKGNTILDCIYKDIKISFGKDLWVLDGDNYRLYNTDLIVNQVYVSSYKNYFVKIDNEYYIYNSVTKKLIKIEKKINLDVLYGKDYGIEAVYVNGTCNDFWECNNNTLMGYINMYDYNIIWEPSK